MKAYYTQEKIASSFRNFFIKFSNLSKPHLKIISYLITGMISAESIVCSDISRKLKDGAKVLKDVLYTRKLFKTNIVVSNYSNTNEPWYLVTNDDTSRAVRNYSYRFGSIECIFKSQKSNGFRLESTNTQKIEHFISLFTVMCVALVWLTIIGVDYVKSKHNYHIKIRDTRKYQKRKTTRLYSFFNLGLTIFNLCYYNTANFTLRFDFILYDV